MASFTNMNFNSDSDTDDEDFVPGEDSGDEELKKSKKKSKKKNLTKGGIRLEDEDNECQTSSADVKAEEERRKEFENEKIEKQEAAEAKRTDDLWSGETTVRLFSVGSKYLGFCGWTRKIKATL